MEPTVDNILAVFRRATPEQYVAGRNWYREAYSIARELDPHNPERAAGVIAALSPQQQWDTNVHFARLTFEMGFACGSTLDNRAKAQFIYDGEDPLKVLTSNKVRNFYLNIINPTLPAVAVDRHAFDIAVGQVTDDKTRTRYLTRKGGYERFANAYRYAALLFNLPAPAMQAITWVVWRDEKGIK
jgi:hypothetical protein